MPLSKQNNISDVGRKSNKTVAKSAIWYTLGGFISKAIGFLSMPLFTRLLSTKEFGDYSNFNSWMLILMVICGLEMFNTINRARFDFDGQELDSYQFTCLLVSTVFTGALFVMYLLNRELFSSILLIEPKYIFVLFIYLFTRPAFDMYLVRQQVKFKYKLASALSLGTALFGTLISLGLTLMCEQDRLMGRIVGQYAPAIILGGIFWLTALLKCTKIKFNYIKYALRLSIPLVISVLSTQILVQSDRILVKQLSDSSAVAFLSLATSASYIILTLIQCFGYAWSPWLMNKLNDGDHSATRLYTTKILWLFSFLTILVNLLSPEIVYILGGSQYVPSMLIVPVNITTCLLSFVVNQFVVLETFKKNVKWAALATLICAIFNISIGAVVIVHFGYEYVCYVTLVANALLMFLHAFIAERIGASGVFSLSSMIVPLFVSVVSIPTSIALFDLLALRYILVVAVAIISGIYLLKKIYPMLFGGKK